MHLTEPVIIAYAAVVGIAINGCFRLLRDWMKYRAEAVKKVAEKVEAQKDHPSETRVQVVVLTMADRSQKVLLPENSSSPKKTSKKRGAKSERKGARGSALNSQGN